jgi:hypothetical protein
VPGRKITVIRIYHVKFINEGHKLEVIGITREEVDSDILDGSPVKKGGCEKFEFRSD